MVCGHLISIPLVALLVLLLSPLLKGPLVQPAIATQAPLVEDDDAKMMTFRDVIDRYAPELFPLETLYKDIHQHPELSGRESRTAAVIARELRSLGLEVHEGIGGFGVVGVLRNGPGKTVLLRAELDALPIQEQTGVPYASKEHMLDWWGVEQPVMHACGHDMHMASLIAATKLLQNARKAWSGTLIALFQPNEEHTGGAQAMVDDGLYERVPVPDAVLAQHLSRMPEGTVSINQGPVLVSADTVRVRLYASQGHPVNPQIAVDVSVVASRVILALQDIVDQLNAEDGYASIFVEEFHAGRPGLDWVDHADLVLDVKAYDPAVRAKLHDGIRNIVQNASAKAGVAYKPIISSSVRAPLTRNDDALAEQLQKAFCKYFGTYNVLEDRPKHPCEDFSILATAVGAPYVFWFLGRVEPPQIEGGKNWSRLLDDSPLEHSPYNAPPVHKTLKTGMRAMSVAALEVFTEGGLGKNDCSHGMPVPY